MSVPVLVVTNAYPDFPDSYHGIFVRRIAERLADTGWHSHILAPRIYRRSLPSEEFPSHAVTRFPFPTAEKLLIEYEHIPKFRIAALLSSGAWSARRIIRKHGCRLIHAHWAFPAGLIGLAAAKMSGLPLLLTVHGSDWRLAAERGGLGERAFLRVARASQAIVSVNREITDWLAGRGIEPSRITTCPVGVDLDIFSPGESTGRQQQRRETVVSTRSLNGLYRVGDLIAAAASMRKNYPSLALTIAGDGPLREELARESARLGLGDNVTFSGRLSQSELAGVLAGSRVYVSTSPAEGTSVSLLEALAAGCLPVVTDIPSNRDWVVHERNGLLFRAGDIDSLAACLARAIEDDGLRDEAAARGPELVAERGSFAGHVGELDRLYHGLTAL